MNDPTPSNSDDRRIQDYLAGRLDAEAAEAFEQRMFEDDALAAEVQRALEIRATAAAPAAAVRPTSGPPRRVLYALAIAASAAVLAVGIGWMQQRPPNDVFRGVEQRMGLEVEVDGGAVRARWQSIAGAAGYELQLFASDGRWLRSVEAEGTAATLELGAPVDSAAPAFVEVSALDDLGQTLQRSERVALPQR